MKKLIIILLTFFSFQMFAGGFKTFVLKENKYVETDIKVEVKSINNICKYLGYNSEEFYTYEDYKNKESKIVTVVLKSFSSIIICVLTDDVVETLSKKDVDNYMLNFNIKKDLRTYSIERDLKDGINNKSLSLKFLSEVFNVNGIDKNGSFVATSIGYELKFKDGILVEYYSSDGLNKWSREWKHSKPKTFNSYFDEAKFYHKDDETSIINEINIQADAFSKIPNGNLNEYIKFHKTDFGNINYKMILISHYNEEIKLEDFKRINFGRYSLTNEFTDKNGYKRTTYKLNKTLYTFDENEKLVNAFTTE